VHPADLRIDRRPQLRTSLGEVGQSLKYLTGFNRRFHLKLDPSNVQYTSLAFGKRLHESGIVSSMGSVGDAYDNAAAESFIATLKSELLYRYSWPTRLDAELAISDFTEVFYNRRRRRSTIGMLSPAEFERRWYEEQELASLVKSQEVYGTRAGSACHLRPC